MAIRYQCGCATKKHCVAVPGWLGFVLPAYYGQTLTIAWDDLKRRGIIEKNLEPNGAHAT